MIKKPYSFKPSVEQLRELKDLSPKEKLDWLEEANQFVAAFVAPEKLEKWRAIISAQKD